MKRFMFSIYLFYAIVIVVLLVIFVTLPFLASSQQVALAKELHQKGEDTAKVEVQLLNEDWQEIIIQSNARILEALK